MLPWIFSLLIYFAVFEFLDLINMWVNCLNFPLSPFLFPSLSLSSFLSVSFLISFCLSFYWFCFSGFSGVIHNRSTLSTSRTWNHGRARLSGSWAQVARYWKILQKACKVHGGDGLRLSFGSVSLCFFLSCQNGIDKADLVLRFTSILRLRSKPSLMATEKESFWGPWKNALLQNLEFPKWHFLAADV